MLIAARSDRTLLCNDQVLGRRVRSLGRGWLRTGDFVVLYGWAERCSEEDARRAVQALFDTGCIADELRDAYLQELT